MSDSVLLFTFSPVQTFIAEARRAEDLFNGSAILVKLAEAAGQALGVNNLIYPADLNKGDIPNVLTAKIPTNEVKTRAEAAGKALLQCWQSIAEQAHKAAKLHEDDTWKAIWERQITQNPPWQIFWASAEMKDIADYAGAYTQARENLDAIKRSRTFEPIEEFGQKDSLSGQREALHKNNIKAKAYWKEMANLPGITASRLRPEGRECLDSVGLVKRFASIRKDNIPSVSTAAAWDFYQRSKKEAPLELEAYRQAIEDFRPALYKPRKDDPVWPFDGDLFFKETLTPGRMKDSYGLEVGRPDLEGLQKLLKTLHEKIGSPSAYYAIIVLDGDDMGKHLERLLDPTEKAEEAHRTFSGRLAEFSLSVQEITTEQNGAFRVYNGGDDVVCLAAREQAIGLARDLASRFYKATGCTASAGVAIAHHLTPLGLALEAARYAEKEAKKLEKKNAICINLLKRSGSPLMARSKWENLDIYDDVLKQIEDDHITSRLPYALERDAPTLAALEKAGQIAGLKYLLGATF